MKQKYPMHEIFASCQSVAFQMQSSASVSRSLRTAFVKCASNVLTEMSRMAATSLYLSFDCQVQAVNSFLADKLFFGSRFGRCEKVDGDFVQRYLLHVLFAIIADRLVAGYRIYVRIEIRDAG